MTTKIASGWIDIMAPLKGLRQAFGDIEKESKKSGDKSAGGFSKKFVAGMAAAGAAAGAALFAGVNEALDRGKTSDKTAAAFGLTPQESAAQGKVAGKLYADAYGESLAEVTDAVALVSASLGEGLGDEAIGDLTAKALDMAAAFDIDVNEAISRSSILVKNGLAKDGVQALDLLTSALQGVAPEIRDEILAATEEYSTFFADLGITGSEAFGLIKTAAEKGGKFGVDKVGDALKELTIRAADGSRASSDALETIGLDSYKTATAIASGGAEARAAFEQIVAGLQGIEDPAMRAQNAVALFGTPIEDLSGSEIPAFLDQLANMGGGLGDVEGAAAAMGDTLNDNAAVRMEAFSRKADEMSARLGEGAISALSKLPGPAQDFAAALKGVGGPIASVVAGVGPLAGGLLTMSAANTTAATSTGVLSMAMSALPFVAIGLAVAALAVVIYKNWDSITAAVGAAVSWIGDRINALVGWFQQIPGWIGGAFSSLGRIIMWPFAKAFDSIASLWNSTIGALSFKVPSWVPGIGGKGFDVPDLPRIQGLAKGGIVTNGGMFRVGESGPETAFLPSGSAVSPMPMSAFTGTQQRDIASVTVVLDSDMRRLGFGVRDVLLEDAGRRGGALLGAR